MKILGVVLGVLLLLMVGEAVMGEWWQGPGSGTGKVGVLEDGAVPRISLSCCTLGEGSQRGDIMESWKILYDQMKGWGARIWLPIGK